MIRKRRNGNVAISGFRVLEDEDDIYSVEEINSYIDSELRARHSVVWKDVPLDVLFSAVMRGSQIITVGYGRAGENYSEVKTEAMVSALSSVERIAREFNSDFILHDHGVLNAVDIEVTRKEMLRRLMDMANTAGNNNNIRYLSPVGYSDFVFGHDMAMNEGVQEESFHTANFGCIKDATYVDSADLRKITPNSMVPWSFDRHNVTAAWELATGAGITVGLIDTGISTSQELLVGKGFKSGTSSQRTVERFGTYDEHDNDQCGHGTQMASAIAGPRNNAGMPMGVAYNSNLVAYRGTEDVVLDNYDERVGVANALKALADREDVRIISMSIGYPWGIGIIEDAVVYAHSKGKLIIAAGGTSPQTWYGVIFPASMEQVVAVTGVRDDGRRCGNCHSGAKIEFTIEMERKEDGNRMLPVLGYRSGDMTSSGGSSIATATVAGIAALAMERYPDASNDEILDKLREAAEFYPERDGEFGYGRIDISRAIQ